MDFKNIFSGLENLGFKDIEHLSLYEEDLEKESISKDYPLDNLVYKKTIECPVCNSQFKATAVKSNAYRLVKKDSDFFSYYSLINPYFYDVWLCNTCGYASLKSEFHKISYSKIDLIKDNISAKWKGRTYPDFYDVDVAIERYKLSLLNYIYLNSKDSIKAMNCLKIAWMYRLKEDIQSEKLFLSESLKGFEKAFFNESYPIFSMDKYSSMYLIGELYRRVEDYEASIPWFNEVIITPGVNSKIKDLAREQRNISKEYLKNDSQEDVTSNDIDIDSDTKPKSKSIPLINKFGFFNKK